MVWPIRGIGCLTFDAEKRHRKRPEPESPGLENGESILLTPLWPKEFGPHVPHIALVTKTGGSARQLVGGNLPLTGTLTTAQAVSGSDAQVVAQR